jgi:CDP-glucose 4,6-dehydratase
MEGVGQMTFGNTYRGKRVLITGHTGFKGSWLSEWLLYLGAEVVGYALPLQPHEKLFRQLNLSRRIAADEQGDIRDFVRIREVINSFRPEFVFHLAAQPLVRASYIQPVETFSTNVMGTVNVLEAVRSAGNSCTIIAVTTDKCYENREWLHAYREEDAIGGHDPYSASKGCAELAISAYRRSFFSDNPVVRLASARAGNVIGGGDWASDRIVPDCIRTLSNGGVIPVRNKQATRPWQHVLEPLSGYLWLGALLHSAISLDRIKLLSSAFNFGPALASNRTVAELVAELLKYWPGAWRDQSDPNAPYEASRLNLSINKAYHILPWAPTWGFARTVQETVDWYLSVHGGDSVAAKTIRQIQIYSSDAGSVGHSWPTCNTIQEFQLLS